MSYINKIFDFFRSVKLAIALTIILLSICVVGGLIPQNANYIDYFNKYGKELAEFITRYSLDHIFTSKWLLFPGILFLFNLLLCTITRFTAQLKKKNNRRFGVDIMHTGLVILGIGAIFSTMTRTTELIQLEEGNSTQLKNGLILQMNQATQELYADNRPSQWTATFSLSQKKENETTIVADHVTSLVNHPFKKSGSKYYLQGYSEIPVLLLQNLTTDNTQWQLYQGDELSNNGNTIMYMMPDTENNVAHLLVTTENKRSVIEAKPGMEIAGYKILTIVTVKSAVINVVQDKGFLFVLIGGILAGVGVTITYIQKFRDSNK